SEMQRDQEEGANEICVPGTLKMYQKHLASVSGIYYLDPPVRYLAEDLKQVVVVESIGRLLTSDLAGLTVSGLSTSMSEAGEGAVYRPDQQDQVLQAAESSSAEELGGIKSR